MQYVVDSAESLRGVPDIDDALWVASAVPTNTLRADKVLLTSLDTDGDGRIRSDELRAGIRWLFATLANPAGIKEKNDTLELAHLASDGDGATCRDAARRVLIAAGTPDASQITLAAVRATREAEEARGLSAAGRLLPAAAGDDAALAALITRAIAVTGGTPHPAGDPSLSADNLAAFLAQGAAWLAWHDEGQLPAGETRSAILPAGADTAAARAALSAVADKLDQYFLLCDAVNLDERLAERARVNPEGTDLLDNAAATALLARAPLALPRPDGKLDLDGALNPAWRDALAALHANAITPLMGAQVRVLDRATVASIAGQLATYADWVAREPATTAGADGVDSLRAMVAATELHERIATLLAATDASAVVLDGVKLLEKLILLQGGLIPVARSMVCTPDLYDTSRRSLFDQGELIIDGRRFNLCIKVTEPARAERFAAASPMFVMFVSVGEKGAAWEYEVAVPVTAGEREHLVDGMWGVYHDVDGRELHAQIRKIAVSPISIKEAVLAPFRRLGDAVQGMLDKSASAQQASLTDATTAKAQAAVDTTTTAPTQLAAQGEAAKAAAAAAPAAAPAAAAPAAAAPAPAPAPAGGMGGSLPMLLAGGGVAFAALASAFTYALQMFWTGAGALSAMVSGLPFVALLGPAGETVVQVISLPLSVIIIVLGVVLVPVLMYVIPVSLAAWFRLRRRDVATLLEGSGWAINTRLYLDGPLARALTTRPPLPK